jgi:hypothetical protein
LKACGIFCLLISVAERPIVSGEIQKGCGFPTYYLYLNDKAAFKGDCKQSLTGWLFREN